MADNVQLPKWAWGMFAGLSTFVMILLCGFATWLGTSTVDQGQSISAIKTSIGALADSLVQIDNKITVLTSVTSDIATIQAEHEHFKSEVDGIHEMFKRVNDAIDELRRKVPDEIPPPWFKAEVSKLKSDVELLKEERARLESRLQALPSSIQ